jgi:hypothetical protein
MHSSANASLVTRKLGADVTHSPLRVPTPTHNCHTYTHTHSFHTHIFCVHATHTLHCACTHTILTHCMHAQHKLAELLMQAPVPHVRESDSPRVTS